MANKERSIKGDGRPSGRFARVLLPLTGFFALVWFLVRVIPKPSRAAYPCQRAAFPLASSFVLWAVGIFGSASLFGLLRRGLYKLRYVLAAAAVVSLAVVGCRGSAKIGGKGADDPVGVAKGIHPGRVAWAHNPDATDWNGDGRFLDEGNVDQEVLDRMMSSVLHALTGEDTDAAAWNALFADFNESRGRGPAGYAPGQRIAVKINENNQNNPYAHENISIDALPHAVLSLLRQLVHEAGAAPEDIFVYDAVRPISDPVLELCESEFPDVNYMGGLGFPNSIDTDFPWTGEIVRYSGGGINDGDAMRIPVFLKEADYLVNMAILKSHDAVTGVTLCGKNNFGSVGNPAALHGSARWYVGDEYSAQVDLMGHEDIGGKTVLYLIDGLFGAVGPGGYAAVPRRWESAPFENDWPSSLFASQDPVAIDSVGLDFLAAEYDIQSLSDGYLREAALADDPPSGTVYDPEGDGTRLESLGTHEHWNNPEDKQYSRNRSKRGKGIELVRVSG